MKKINLLKLIVVPAVVGLMLSLSFCKKDTETINNTIHDPVIITQHDTIRINDSVYVHVHDTVSGKTVSGVVTYPDYTNAPANAAGAVVVLYSGPVVNSNLVAGYAIANAGSGSYSFPFLIPGTYTLYAKYNTDNKNARAIDGINFETNPAVTITISSNTTQNLSLTAIIQAGATKITLDTVRHPGYLPATWDIHSKVSFGFYDHTVGSTLPGGFNVFNLTDFAFDQANPANIVFKGYVLISSTTTQEPTRDALGISGSGTNNLPASQATGCIHATLDNYVDSGYFYANANAANKPLGITDTAWFVSNSVVTYGDGYLCHGTLTAFYKHVAPGPIGSSSYDYKSDTTGFAASAGHPYDGPMTDQMISLPVDMYFNYEKSKFFTGANFQYWFAFQGEFSFRPMTDFKITSAHFADGPINISVGVEMQGQTNREY